ncbi:23S rRNA (uracil(747)-C(5))-methyltransferase RlmC [Shewanella litorisediminis]|uniref:23S rRNA (uracil(747)-C(5))-methyltransferase RlmC n=1 Tax=Shewanella litorisediminis TaxID=1173586 RepID=A0ABX7G8I3_9GAMM|nr:23S rRNA (uracil(747)-C(5))-methyltransferase RlmC [Shewanella litorisediminis]MCL2917961.1 23S rRNA (uracil(747)-C(5))-methyltransferase RlmC [Shewanella litorisediminis]QRH03556.1 23S rRNA (uracil(747)-C(5))-methyltransferase RlmC [Shewanella litorisediminis]
MWEPNVSCDYFNRGLCQSCRLMPKPVSEQLLDKEARLTRLLGSLAVDERLAPVSGPEFGFRNKAKMVVMGAAHAPVLGIPGPDGQPVDLSHCPLYPQDMQALLVELTAFVRRAGIPPYRVDKAKGELKFILLTRSAVRGEFMLRFVLRSKDAIPRIERELPKLMADFPAIKVVSVNLQPVHMARLEGEEEIFLTQATRLDEVFNGVPLFIRPKSFFQTNPEVASSLYATAARWVDELKPKSLWDLFCGVGGFGLHCASHELPVTGIEIEAEAIDCAKTSAAAMGLDNLSFAALDSTGFAMGQEAQDVPEVIIVNPPRRGTGKELCERLSAFGPKAIIYSSCNPETLAEDLALISGYRIARVQLFDMFPHSDHFEVLCLLIKEVACANAD